MKQASTSLLENYNVLIVLRKTVKLIHSNVENQLTSRALMIVEKIVENAKGNLEQEHLLDYLRDLRLLLETCIQLSYLSLKHGDNVESALRELGRRRRTASIFNAKMITKMPLIHGSIKNRILHLYLELAEYSHPTERLLEVGETKDKIVELTRSVVDYSIYTLLVAFNAKNYARDIVDEAKKYNLERTLKYLGK